MHDLPESGVIVSCQGCGIVGDALAVFGESLCGECCCPECGVDFLVDDEYDDDGGEE